MLQSNRQTIPDFNEAQDDGVAVACTRPYANHLHLTTGRHHSCALLLNFFTGRMFSIMARKFVETQFPLFCANQKGQSTEDRWVLICLSRLINIRFTLQGWGHRSTKLFHNLQQSLNLNQQLIVKTACVYTCMHMHTRICTHLACTTVTYNTARNSSDYLIS